MARLRSLWLVAPLFLAGACSIINAPADVDPGTGGGGNGGEGGAGGVTTSDSTSTAIPTECGDGKLEGDEGCDDDNTADGDGCSAACQQETGYTCTGDPGGLSTCELNCGNGKLDDEEECDDGGKADVNPAPGDQDACTATCKFKEFDIESAETMVTHEAPIVGFRKDRPDDDEPEEPAFFAIWHASLPDKLRGRRYRRDGLPLLGTGMEDISGTFTPDATGHAMCTAPGNRSIVVWRETGQETLHSRKIESTNGLLQPIENIAIKSAEPNPSCAASLGSGTFIAVTTSKPSSSPLWDVIVQPFTSFALPTGSPIDIGDTTAPNDTTAWGLSDGFLVAWIVDPPNNTGFTAQPLDKNGALVGTPFTLSDPADVDIGEPFAARIGTSANDNSFVFGYTRAATDGHREVVFRTFQWTNLDVPPVGSAPVVVSADPISQSEPSIAVNSMSGRFLIVWTSAVPNGEDVVYATFQPNGMPITPPTKAPENLVGKQTHPGAAVDPASGDVFIAWSNDNPSDTKPGRISGKMFSKLLP